MSTLKVTNIESPSGGGVSAKINDIGGGQLSNRNMIINGNMAIAQRGTSATFNSGTSDAFASDRFKLAGSCTELIGTLERAYDAATGVPDLPFSLKWTTNTAESAVDATDLLYLAQYIEGFNVQSPKFGTSAAQQTTLSFWVKCSIAGTYVVSIYRGTTNRNIVTTYTVNSANTWEYKTITFAADTTGVITPNINEGVRLNWHLMAGSNYTGTDASTWGAYSGNRWAGNGVINNSVPTTLNATWEITGVQYEVGDLATPFEHRSYGDEELRCMRYYQRFAETLPSVAGTDDGFMTFANYTGTAAYGGQKFTVPMRGRPSMAAAGCAYYSNGATDNSINVDLVGASTNYGEIRVTAISVTGGHAGWLRIEGSGAYIEFNAEL